MNRLDHSVLRKATNFLVAVGRNASGMRAILSEISALNLYERSFDAVSPIRDIATTLITGVSQEGKLVDLIDALIAEAPDDMKHQIEVLKARVLELETSVEAVAASVLTGPQRKVVRSALEQSVGDRGTMKRILSEAGLGTFEALSNRDTLSNQFSEIIDTLNRRGDIHTLIAAVREEFPRAPSIVSLNAKLQITEAPPEPDGTPGADRLEAIVGEAGFSDMSIWADDIVKIGQAVCRITLGHTMATGILIGPRTVLTAFHVIKGLLSSGNPAIVELRFGFARDTEGFEGDRLHRLAPDWLDQLASSPGLDFAVLNLAEEAGNDRIGDETRGWVDIGTAVPTPKTGDIVFVLQHPSGSYLKQSTGVMLPPPGNGAIARLNYAADTLPGSSGALVLDHTLAPVALHQTRQRSGKQGVSLAVIAEAIGQRARS